MRVFGHKAFTMVELLATIAIIATLVAVIVPVVGNYVRATRSVTDEQTLTVLNDAISRYKMGGGNMAALTEGKPFANLLTALQTPVSWNGVTHQFWRGGQDLPNAITVSATGNGRTYRLTGFNTFDQGGGTELGGGGGGFGDRFYALASGSADFYYSTDGVNWSTTTGVANAPWFFATGEDRILGVAYSDVVYSLDGVNWTAETRGTASWSGLAYGSGKFVLTSYYTNQAPYTADGITWQNGTLPNSSPWGPPVSDGTNFVVLKEDVIATAAYSTNGTTWATTTLPSSQDWRKPAAGEGKFVTVAYGTNAAAYSTDGGATWNAATLPSSANWSDVYYVNGRFYARASNSNALAYSEDGVTWSGTTFPSSGYWSNIAYGNGRYVAARTSNSTAAAYSADGINWTAAVMPAIGGWTYVAFANGVFVSVNENTGTAVAVSADGETWSPAAMPVSASWYMYKMP